MSIVVLPALGESVTEGTVIRWLKSVGDAVAVDEPLVEVSTDKVDTEVPSPVAGTLIEISADEDETIKIGAKLAVIESKITAPALGSPPPAPGSAPTAPGSASTVSATDLPIQQQQHDRKTTYFTPLVRRLATEHSVDLDTITGSGIGGRVRKQDVLDVAKAQSAARAASQPTTPGQMRRQTVKMTRLRKLLATRMVESLQTSAQLTTVVEVDVSSIARLRRSVKDDFAAREGVKLSFMPFFAKAAVDALKSHPSLNAAVDMENDEVTYFDHENLSIAVDTERGLLAPVIINAGDLSVRGLARAIADLADRTRNNKISPDELAGGTFTLTNTGSRGALFDTPIINQPQVAILGTGTVVKRPVVIDDPNLGETIAVRHMLYLALTYDHRIVDGADAARYLSDVKKRLEAGRFEV